MPMISDNEEMLTTRVQFPPSGNEGGNSVSNEFNVTTAIDQCTVFTMLPAKGDKGDPGESAYTIAVQHGYRGSEAEWEELMTHTYENAQAAQDAADQANDAKQYVQAIVDQGLGAEYYNKTEVNERLALKANANALNDYYTENQINGILSSNYYTKSVVDDRLGYKANISDVNSFLTVVTASKTVNASRPGTTAADITVDVPSGYTAIGVVGTYITYNGNLSGTTIVGRAYLSDATTVSVLSYYTGSQTGSYTITVYTNVLCVKTLT